MKTFLFLIALLSLMVLAASLSAPATSSLDWTVRDSGGGYYSVGNSTLNSSIGQPVSGLYFDTDKRLHSAVFRSLCTGFLCYQYTTWQVYLPSVSK